MMRCSSRLSINRRVKSATRLYWFCCSSSSILRYEPSMIVPSGLVFWPGVSGSGRDPRICSRTTSPGAIPRNKAAERSTTTISSIQPANGIMSGTKSIGEMRYTSAAGSINFARSGTRLSSISRVIMRGMLVLLISSKSPLNSNSFYSSLLSVLIIPAVRM